MHGVAAAEDPALGVLRGPGLVNLPGGDVLDLDVDAGVADHLADAGQDRFGAQVGFGAVDVITPAGDPLVPGADDAEGAHADLAVAGAGGHDPVQDAGPVRHVPGQVGLEQGVDGGSAAHDALDRQAEFPGDLRAGASFAKQRPDAPPPPLPLHDSSTDPHDFTGPYVLLASRSQSGPITGQAICVDGGIGVRGFATAAGGDHL